MGNRQRMFGLLFKSAQHTLLTLAKDDRYIGAVPGIVSILHTNGQDLNFHPHVHNIVSGGGMSKDGVWVKEKRSNGKFLFPRRSMEKMYKGYFISHLRKYITTGELKYKDKAALQNILSIIDKRKWNVYAKAPFGGPAQIVEYLGRYTHKVAITAHRIISIDDNNISFRYKDYQDGNKQKVMTLSHVEFLRRFEQHILPKGLVKIRHSGYLHSKDKMKRIAEVCRQLQLPTPMPRVAIPATLRLMLQTGKDVTVCPVCRIGKLQLVRTMIFYNGRLIDVLQLRNRGSPRIKNEQHDE